jgi:thioredoxin-like negative regulator of GroEL
VYFFAVKLRDFNVHPTAASQSPRQAQPALPELEQACAESPSFHNRTRLAWALIDAGEPARAAELFERALSTHASDKHAQLGLGYALLDAGKPEQAIGVLGGLVERSFGYAEYSAAQALLEAFERTGQDERAVELSELIARDSQRTGHQLLLARQYARVQRRVDAIAVLRSALREFEALPDYERRRNGASATEARKLLDILESGAPDGAPRP